VEDICWFCSAVYGLSHIHI